MKSKIWLMFSLILVFSGISLAQKATKTITNADLEKFKQKRLQSEEEYRAKHKELGMPSPEELEKRNAEDKQRLIQLSNKIRYEQQQNQDYWQTQTAFLRNQIADVNAQINYLNRLIAKTPTGNKIVYNVDELNGLIISSFAFGGVGNGYRGGFNRHQQITTVNPANNVQTAINAAAANPNPYSGTPLYSTGVRSVIGSNPPRRGFRGHYGGGFYPYFVNNGNFQRDDLISRVQYLGQVRAGLLAQWRTLVEEAHRAGVKIN